MGRLYPSLWEDIIPVCWNIYPIYGKIISQFMGRYYPSLLEHLSHLWKDFIPVYWNIDPSYGKILSQFTGRFYPSLLEDFIHVVRIPGIFQPQGLELFTYGEVYSYI